MTERTNEDQTEEAVQTNVILSGSVNAGEGMSMELSAAANNLPEGRVLHWHTELVSAVEAVEPAAAAGEQDDETNEKPEGEE